MKFATLPRILRRGFQTSTSQSTKSLRLPREKHFELPKTSREAGVLTLSTSKSLSRAGVVQILRSSTSKSAPSLPVFNGFDFRIARAAADPSHHLAFRTYLCEPSKPRNYGKTQHFAQFLPAKISHVSHLCCKTYRQLSVQSEVRTSKLPLNMYICRVNIRVSPLQAKMNDVGWWSWPL